MENNPIRPSGNEVAVYIRVHPGSSRKRIEGNIAGRIQVYVNAPPEAGRANSEALKVLADALGIRPSALKLARGEKSRQKTVLVSGLPVEMVKLRLKADT
jgi:uncharacterized protein (TIGR00251 family)